MAPKRTTTPASPLHPSPQNELTDACGAFGLDGHTLRPIEAGYVSSLWRVDCTEHAPLVLKRFHDKFSNAQLEGACRAQEAVARALGISPRVLASREGRLFALAGSGRYALFPFLAGTRVTPGAGPTPEALACLIGRVHLALEGLPDDVGSRAFLSLDTLQSDAVEKALASARAARADDAEILGWLLRKRELLSQVPRERLEIFSGLQRQWIHGDLHPDNLLAAAGVPGGLALLDFDQACVFPVVYEVLRAFLRFHPPGVPNLEMRLQHFVAAYVDQRPDLRQDLLQMVELYFWIHTAETRTFTDDEGQVRGVREFARQRMWLGEWLAAARPRLQRAVELGLAVT